MGIQKYISQLTKYYRFYKLKRINIDAIKIVQMFEIDNQYVNTCMRSIDRRSFICFRNEIHYYYYTCNLNII